MSRAKKCPNCAENIAGHPDTGCVLNALIGVVRDRGNTSERKLRQIHAAVDTDALWIDIGPIVDSLEDGRYR